MTEFQIRKNSFTTTRLMETPDQTLADGEILAKIDAFAVTSNNITYAAAGDQLGYWQFFQPTDDGTRDEHGSRDGWGLMPVWGFADVVASKTEGISKGERLFGYWPPATHLRLQPSAISDAQFFDGAEHRAKLPSGYNLYRRVGAEPGHDRSMDQLRMLLWPLFVTSFCLWDALKESQWFEAQQMVIVSASSKTSIGLAYALNQDHDAPSTVGLTSPRNLPLVERLGLYDRGVVYDQVETIDSRLPTVIVDMAGNRNVLGRLHDHLGENMKRTISVGLTHWDQAGQGEGVIAERTEFFFAPSHIQKRIKDWGADGFATKSSEFVLATAAKTRDWLEIETVAGLEGLSEIFEDVCEGRIAPHRGLIVKLPD